MLDNEGNSSGESLPLVEFVGELFLSRFGEGVELGDTAGFSGFGFGLDPALLLEAVKGRVERALLDEKDVIRYLLDALGDRPTMNSVVRQRFQNEEVKSALDEIGWSAHTMIIYKACR